MLYLLLKAAISGLLVAIVSEVARRWPGFGGLIASLPLVSVLGMIWLWRDRPDAGNMAAHAEATFWFVLPSLPMFLVIPALLRHGVGFWAALTAGCLLTMLLYAATLWLGLRLGLRVSPALRRLSAPRSATCTDRVVFSRHGAKGAKNHASTFVPGTQAPEKKMDPGSSPG